MYVQRSIFFPFHCRSVLDVPKVCMKCSRLTCCLRNSVIPPSVLDLFPCATFFSAGTFLSLSDPGLFHPNEVRPCLNIGRRSSELLTHAVDEGHREDAVAGFTLSLSLFLSPPSRRTTPIGSSFSSFVMGLPLS
jgi:hypothetical protein